MKLFRKLYAIALASGLVLFPPLALAQSLPQVPSYASTWNLDYEQFPAGPISVSTTYLYTIAMGHAAIITSIRAAAITAPSATGDVTVQFFKNSTAAGNAMTGVFDLNSVTSGVTFTVPLSTTVSSNNFLLGQNDILVCQYVTGASLGGAVGVTATAVAKTVTYSNQTSF